MSPEPVLGSREALLLVGGIMALVGIAFVASRLLRSARHGLSIRLQLFLAMFATGIGTTVLIGLWVVDRLQHRAAQLMDIDGRTSEAVVELLRDFGPKMTVLVSIVGVGAGGAAFFLGRLLARPIEALNASAEDIARGARRRPLPAPVGREVRHLTASFERMRIALEERHQMERFVADLSHELKNPVSAIRAATEVLLDGAADDPGARARFLGRIDEAGHRLEVLLKDLLALARIEAGGLAFDEAAFSLADVARAALDARADDIEAKGLRLEARLVGPRTQGSRRWLRRAVDNLLDNALRYSPEGGALLVECGSRAGLVYIRVGDRGPGVPEANREAIFARFVTDRAGAGGTGLGLAITRSVAEQHGGSARLVAVDGWSAVFELSCAI